MDPITIGGYMQYTLLALLVTFIVVAIDAYDSLVSRTNTSWETHYTRNNFNLTFGIKQPIKFYPIALLGLMVIAAVIYWLELQFVGWTVIAVVVALVWLAKYEYFPNDALWIFSLYCCLVEVVKVILYANPQLI